jgi:hypothetical protein
MVCVGACSSPFGRDYEYEEQLYLSVDGSARAIISASIPALVALRNLPLDANPRARVDRDVVERIYASNGCTDVRVGQPWIRRGRHFVQVRVDATDVTALAHCAPLSWSRFTFQRGDGVIHYEQQLGPASGVRPADVNWNGSELVSFKLHLPGRILFHNVKRLDGSNGEPDRGNILTWEQRLSDRLAGQPLDMVVTMDGESILHRTLWLFASAFVAAVVVLMLAIWLTVRHARRKRLFASRPPA